MVAEIVKSKLSKSMDELKGIITEAKKQESKEYRTAKFLDDFFERYTGTEATTDNYIYCEYVRTIWRESINQTG